MPAVKYRKKTYAIEERMSGDWLERWGGFTSFAKALSFLRRMDSQCHGTTRIVRVSREPVGLKGLLLL